MSENWLSNDLRRRPGLIERLGAIEPDRMATMLVVGFVLAAASVVGLVAATGQPIPIALVVGSLGGLMLLQFPMAAVWVILVGVLLISGPLFMHQPALLKAGWLFSLLGFFLILVSVLYPVLGRNRAQGRVPPLVGWAVLFILAGLISLAYSDGPMNEGVTAVKRYYQYLGLAFLFAAMPVDVKTIRRIIGLLGLMLIGHLILSAYQRFWIVPQWDWLAGVRGFIPLDLVVGTFEGVMGAGGSSAVMAFSCLVGLVAVMAARRERVLTLPTALMWGLIALIPLGMGETRVIVLWLPLALIALNMDLIRKKPATFIVGLVVAGVLTIGVTYIYAQFQTTDTRQLTLQERIDEAIEGNFGRGGYTGNDGSLNRTSVIRFWWQQNGLQAPTKFMFGHGIGSSFGGDGRGNGIGHLDAAYRGRGIALTGVSTLLWDLGIVGFSIYMTLLASAAVTALKLTRIAAAGLDRAFCRTLFVASVLMLTMPVYTNMVLSVPSIEVLSALFMGFIAWRWRLKHISDPFGDARRAEYLQAQARGSRQRGRNSRREPSWSAGAVGQVPSTPLLPARQSESSGRNPGPRADGGVHGFGRSSGRPGQG